METSDTNATVGVEQLSAASVTTEISGTGIPSAQSILIGAGFEAVGNILSFTFIACKISMVFPQPSSIRYVLIIS